MKTNIYFCLFCPHKIHTDDEELLNKHIINRHLDQREDPITNKWIDSVLKYQTELNQCLSSDPKSLPNSSICQTMNSKKQKLLKGCLFCDKIIETFKLDVISMAKRFRDVCVCGGGKEMNKVVVICRNCRNLYHYDCVEPSAFTGLALSLQINFKPLISFSNNLIFFRYFITNPVFN